MATCEVCGGPCNNKHSVCRASEGCRREYRRRAQDALLERLGDFRPDNWDEILEQARGYQQRRREAELAQPQRERERRRKRYQKYRENEDAGHRAWRQANLERIRAWEKSYRQDNLEKIRACEKRWYRANRDRILEQSGIYRSVQGSTVQGRARRMFLGARARARERGLPFDLTAEWVESELALALENGCPLLGIEITLNAGPRSPSTPSIDRFRPELGYTQGNCWVISFRANAMKRDATLDFMRRVLEYADTRFAVGLTVEMA